MSGATGLRFTFASSSSSREPLPSHDGVDLMSPGGTDAPFFARIKTVEELQKCKQDVEALQARVNDLERISSDLEVARQVRVAGKGHRYLEARVRGRKAQIGEASGTSFSDRTGTVQHYSAET